jgi:hypothetical protein
MSCIAAQRDSISKRRLMRLALLAAALVAVNQLASASTLRLVTWHGPTAAAGPQPVSEATKRKALKSFEKLPVSFVRNAGQADPRVRYYAQGAWL